MSKQGNNMNSKISILQKDYDTIRGKGLSVTELCREENFVRYMELLNNFSKRYIVAIVSNDTAVGPYFGKELSSLLKKMGLKFDLEGKFRLSYSAIIDAGIVKFEKLATSLEEPVEYNCKIDNIDISVCGTGFNVDKKFHSHVIINGTNYATSGRGLNFVVYDKVTEKLLDAVNFDTYSAAIICVRPSFIQEEIFNFKKEHPGVSIMTMSYPNIPSQNMSYYEQLITKYGISRGMIVAQPDNPAFVLNQFIDTPEGIIEVLNAPKSYHDMKGIRHFENKVGKYVNVVAGHRVTVGQPKAFKRTIYMVGGCKMFGIGAADKGTISSLLQKHCNEQASNQEIIVENYGFFLGEIDDAKSNEIIKILKNLPAKAGDIVIIDFGRNKEIPHVDSSIQRPHSYGEIFFDMIPHLTENGNQLIADKIFDKLLELDFFSSDTLVNKKSDVKLMEKYSIDNSYSKELQEYKRILTEFYTSAFVPVIGSVVMNCNPFTLGHRYLIEQALLQCDHLIIFVVQEDRSYFSFDERISLVDAGVSNLNNVTVIPGGRFIISSLTFSDYFNKSNIQERVIDSSLDIELFATEIAPCLNIKVRFAGEEPFDNITRQYNRAMNSMLPKYGIEFVEIPREKFDGIPISASEVRRLLNKKDFDRISKLVPNTTLDYLKNIN